MINFKTNEVFGNPKKKSKDDWVGDLAKTGIKVLGVALSSLVSGLIGYKFYSKKMKKREDFEDRKRKEDEEAKIREEKRREERMEAHMRNRNAANNPDGFSGCAPSSVQDLNQIHVEEYKEDDYGLYKNLLSKGDVCVLYGPRGCGKTTLAVQLAKELCVGRTSRLVQPDHFFARPQTILYYDGEHSDMYNAKLFGRGDMSEFNNFKLLRGFSYSTPQMWLKDVEERLNFQRSDAVVFLDNLSCICSTNNANTMREFILNDFRQLQKKLEGQGCKLTLVLLAHPNKEGGLSGSMNLQNFATTILEIKKVDQDRVVLTVSKNRFWGDAQGKDFYLGYHKDKNDCQYYVIEDEADANASTCTTNRDKAQEKQDQDYQLYLQATKLYEEGKTWTEVSEQMKISRPTINKLRERFKNAATVEELSQNAQSTVA